MRGCREVPRDEVEAAIQAFLERDYPRYLERVRAAQLHPANGPGHDKSWVHRAQAVWRDHFRKARRVET